MRVVLDTNVLVSLVLSGGRLAPIWQAWRRGKFVVLVSTELLEEVTQVLARPRLAKYIDRAETERLLEDLRTLTRPVDLGKPYPPFEDVDDRFLLAMARDGRADALVTGDGAMEDLGNSGTTLIVSPAQFLAVFKES